MELDLNKFNVVRAIPFEMRKPGTGKYVAQRRMTELNSVEWTTTENRIFIGHRDFLLMKTENAGVEPFATASIPLAGKEAGETKSNESLSAYIQQSTPQPNASGRLPVPSKAAKKITAFCGTEGKIFFANSNGIFCWDEARNSLSLLASSHMINGSSPLDGGTPYSVYWMGADVQRNRIILAIHEPKDGNPQIWGGLLGDRTGVWTYDLNNREWRQLAKMTLGNLARTIVYAKGKNTEEFQVLEFHGLERNKYRGKFIHVFKVFPVPDGALVWHLIKKKNNQVAHKLMYWKLDAAKTRREP